MVDLWLVWKEISEFASELAAMVKSWGGRSRGVGVKMTSG